MRALVYTGEKTLEMQDADEPVPMGDDVLVRVESVGICGSDMHAFLGHDERRPPPLILGHEAAGTVLSGPMEGRRVTVNPLVTCGACPACRSGRENICPDRQIISMHPRPGAFAQIVAVPPSNLVEIPDDLSFDAAALVEPFACGWHAIRLARRALSVPLEDARVLVLGGGAIGVGAALSLAAGGAGDVLISEPNAAKRVYLERNCGLPSAVPDAIPAQPGFDLIIDAVGIDATHAQAISSVLPGGVVMHIGLGGSNGQFDIRRMTLQEITLIGTYTYAREDFQATAEAIIDGRMGSLDWMEIRPLNAGQSAFEDILAGKAAAPKIVLRPYELD